MTVIVIITQSFMFFKHITCAEWMQTTQTTKYLQCDLMLFLWVILLLITGRLYPVNCEFTFQSKIMPLFIMNETTWFLRLRLYFNLYANLIVFVLCATNKILTLFRMGTFGAAHMTHPLTSADISVFPPKNKQIFLYHEIQT